MAINPKQKAKDVLSECGLDELTDFPLDLFIAGLGGTLIEEELHNCDGRIIFGSNKSIIKVNSLIQFEERKRFVIAHEIGHLLLHKGLQLPDDDQSSLNIIQGTEMFLKTGLQELQANEFAAELLMPSELFLSIIKGKKFSPLLLKELSERFKVSITAAAFKYMEIGPHPIFIAVSQHGKVRYWKKSTLMKIWVSDITKLPPPDGSVALEYIKAGYDYVYTSNQKAQVIFKSTWFNLSEYEKDQKFFEYCIPTKSISTVTSIIWETI